MSEAGGRPLPQVPEAEASLLGALLLEPARLDDVRPIVRVDDFSREAHRLIYGALRELADQGQELSYQSLTARLAERGELELVGGGAAIVSLIQATPVAAHIRGYAVAVERAGLLRRLIGAAQDIARLALTRDDAQEALRDAQTLLFGVSESRLHREVVGIEQALRELFESIEIQNERGRERAVPTGFPSLDEMLGSGLHPGDLIIVAGRPGLGKTSFALNVMRNAALRSEAVCAIFSLEMKEEDLTLRLLSGLAEIDGSRLRRGALDMDELQAISQASAQLMQRGIFIEECTRLTVTDVMTHARKLQARSGLGLIVIDYLQLMEGAGRTDENRVVEIGSITRGLKAIARELEVPIVVLSQLSRQIERRTGGEPKLSDLRECVTGDTRVVDAGTGRWAQVRELRPGAKILAMDSARKLRTFELADVWSTGVKPIFRVTSQTGRVIRATAKHPFLTPQGWRRLEELRAGDTIATARRLPPHGVEQPARADPRRPLGYMAKDGTQRRRGAVGLSSSDPETFADVLGSSGRESPSATLDVGWRDHGKRTRRSTALPYADRTGDELLRTEAESDVLWEPIREIAAAGEEEVFDLRVPASGNFLANGFVVHNSGAIEQDADVVLFLWRKEQEKREAVREPVIELRVAKHRHGPTGDLQVVFEYEYTRFRELSGAA